jgi:large subunit ribosomal protein L20
MHGLKVSGSTLNRKVLADIAVNDGAAFAALCETAKRNIG